MGRGCLGICLAQVAWRLQPICVQQQEEVNGYLLSTKVWQFRLTVPDGMYKSP